MGEETKGTIFWNKIRLLNIIGNQTTKGVNFDIILEKVFNQHTKFHEFKEEVFSIKDTDINEIDLQHLEKQITFEKQYIASEVYLEKFKNYLEKIENREFEGVEEIETELQAIIEELYMGFVRETNLAKSLDGVKIIDYSDPHSLMDHMKDFYDGKNYIPSGYKNIDKLFGGGFERTRLYLFAGRPGSGKSTILLNLADNMSQLTNLPGYEDTYVLYLTFENLALESNQRFLCRHLNLTQAEIQELIKNEKSNQIIIDCLNEFKKNNLVISYFPPRTFGTSDLFSYVENLNMERGQKPLAIFVDYLDLMKLPLYIKDFRLQLGDITLGLKTLGVMHKIPVVSVTQLLKGAYGSKPTLGDIKESSEKIDHSDVIGMLNRLDNGDNWEDHIYQYGFNAEVSFDKTRGCRGGTLQFAMMLDKFKIEEPKSTNSGPNPMSYLGTQSDIPPMHKSGPPIENKEYSPPKFTPPTMSAFNQNSNSNNVNNNQETNGNEVSPNLDDISI
jgi:replicative DNA helicase